MSVSPVPEAQLRAATIQTRTAPVLGLPFEVTAARDVGPGGPQPDPGARVRRAQIGYEAYGAAAGWKTFDGRPMPTWEDLGMLPHGAETRRRWEVAAAAIAAEATAGPYEPPQPE